MPTNRTPKPAEPSLREKLLAQVRPNFPLHKQHKAEFFVDRALERGLTDEDVLWNQRLGRPPHWIETQHPEEETKRREAWLLAHEERRT